MKHHTAYILTFVLTAAQVAAQTTTFGDSPLLKGGDVSMLSLVENNGGKYFDTTSKRCDCMELLAENGMNLARLRLYNDPGNTDFSPSCRLPKGYEDAEDILRLASRAKKCGMEIELTFHYSDYWTNGTTQTKPHAWEGCSFDALCDSVYAYTFSFLKRMEAQGTTPQYVSIGNEIQAGILYPDGACSDFGKLSKLLQQGCKAVRDASPKTQIIMHLDDGGNVSKYEWFLSELKLHSVDYDIVGASYYPFWTGRTIEQIMMWADSIYASYGKPILLMEVGYAWRVNCADGMPGQLSNNGPYTAVTTKGQADFIDSLNKALFQSPTSPVIGYIYWDPIFIPAGDTGWELGGRNVVSNSTLFNFYGQALPALNKFQYVPYEIAGWIKHLSRHLSSHESILYLLKSHEKSFNINAPVSALRSQDCGTGLPGLHLHLF